MRKDELKAMIMDVVLDLVEAERNYRKEYDNYHSSPEQKKNRAKRNNARRRLERDGRVSKGDGKDVDHKNPIRSGGGNGDENLRVRDKSSNRKDNGQAVTEATDAGAKETAKKVKSFMKSNGVGKVSVRTSSGKSQYIQASVRRPDTIPNDIRAKVIKTVMPNAKVGNWENINYGNVTDWYITLRAEEWEKVVG